MTTVAEFTLPAESFPLGSIFAECPDVTVELERFVPTGTAIVPYFWVAGESREAADRIEAAFADHPYVEEARVVDRIDDEFLLRVEWGTDYDGLLSAVEESAVSVVTGVGRADGWRFQVRSDDREGIAAFQSACRARGLEVDLASLHGLTSLARGGDYGLTPEQREALVLAYQMGYFDSPRTATLEDVASELGITRQSLSSRLRRGHRRLVGRALVDPADADG